jgi:hypothetical protein
MGADNTQDQVEETTVDSAMEKSLSSAVDDVLEAEKAQAEEEKPDAQEEEPAETDESGGDSTPGADGADTEGEPTETDESGDDEPEEEEVGEEEEQDDPEQSAEVSDDLLTRAVRAGLSLKEAREIGSPAALERTVQILEERTGGGDSTDEGEGADEEEEADPLDAIPDLDPEEYDENIVKGFKTLKDLVREQRETISKLSENGRQAEGQDMTDWFDGRVSGLDRELTKVLGKGTRREIDPGGDEFAARAKLAEQVQVLASGYESRGIQKSRDELFDEAVRIAFPDEFKQSEQRKVSEKLGKRERQLTSRPGNRRVEAQGDIDVEVAKELRRKFPNISE